MYGVLEPLMFNKMHLYAAWFMRYYFSVISKLKWCACRELDHGMLRRLEKRILVDLPVGSARAAMFSHHLPPTISQPPTTITTQIDYDRAAEVSHKLGNRVITASYIFILL